jgi:hypothetical protein
MLKLVAIFNKDALVSEVVLSQACTVCRAKSVTFLRVKILINKKLLNYCDTTLYASIVISSVH